MRTVSPAGGGAHTLLNLPAGGFVQSVGGGELVYSVNNTSLRVVQLASGTTTSCSSGAAASDNLLGAAVSPDGTQVMYATAQSTGHSQLRVLTVATCAWHIVQNYTSPGHAIPVPNLWTATGVMATELVPFADVGAEGAAALDPSSGAVLHSNQLDNTVTPAFSGDGSHAAYGWHTGGLGDDADASGGPGPQNPFNTLRTFAVGSSPTNLYEMAHHTIHALAMSIDGSTILYSNDSSAGAFAGIGMSPDFGLFMYSGGSAHQLEHLDGTRWDAGVFVDAATAAAARSAASGEQLVLVGGTHSAPQEIDSVTGSDGALFVGYSPIS